MEKDIFENTNMEHYFRISHNKDAYTKPIPFHSHDFYEIYFFLDGTVTYYIENESYNLKKGDVLVIPPGKLHRAVIESDMPYERYVLWIYANYIPLNVGIDKYIKKIIAANLEKNTRLASFQDTACVSLKALFDQLLSEFLANEELSCYLAESCILLILGKILESFQHMEKAEAQPNDLIKQVISFLNQNVVHAPTLEELSATFFVSKYYLSHKFKEYTKTTIHQYILLKKITLAKELLEKGKTPSEVCRLCGFSTYSNFYKVFTLQTGVSPGRYQKN